MLPRSFAVFFANADIAFGIHSSYFSLEEAEGACMYLNDAASENLFWVGLVEQYHNERRIANANRDRDPNERNELVEPAEHKNYDDQVFEDLYEAQPNDYEDDDVPELVDNDQQVRNEQGYQAQEEEQQQQQDLHVHVDDNDFAHEFPNVVRQLWG